MQTQRFCPSDRGGGGAEASLAAAGAGHSDTQLPESHPGESASTCSLHHFSVRPWRLGGSETKFRFADSPLKQKIWNLFM